MVMSRVSRLLSNCRGGKEKKKVIMRSSVHNAAQNRSRWGGRDFWSIFLLERVQTTHSVTVLIKNGDMLALPLNSRWWVKFDASFSICFKSHMCLCVRPNQLSIRDISPVRKPDSVQKKKRHCPLVKAGWMLVFEVFFFYRGSETAPKQTRNKNTTNRFTFILLHLHNKISILLPSRVHLIIIIKIS